MAKASDDPSVLSLTGGRGIPLSEIEFDAIRAQGSGGQNVNKVSTAVHLRFDVQKSSLSAEKKQQVLAFRDRRISNEGVIIIKAQKFRSQDKNRSDALERLRDLILEATTVAKKRKATKPTWGSQKRRVDSKNKRGKVKSLRKKIDY